MAMVFGASQSKKDDTKGKAIRILIEKDCTHEQRIQTETQLKKSKGEEKRVQKRHGIYSQFFEFFFGKRVVDQMKEKQNAVPMTGSMNTMRMGCSLESNVDLE